LIDELGLSSLAEGTPVGHYLPERFVVTRDDSVDVFATVSAFIDILTNPREAWLREKILNLLALARQPKEPEEQVLNERQQILKKIFESFPGMDPLKAEALAQALPFGIGGTLRYGADEKLAAIQFDAGVFESEQTQESIRAVIANRKGATKPEVIDPAYLAEINRTSEAYAPLKRRVESLQRANKPNEETSQRPSPARKSKKSKKGVK
jgi:hypothetical protein